MTSLMSAPSTVFSAVEKFLKPHLSARRRRRSHGRTRHWHMNWGNSIELGELGWGRYQILYVPLGMSLWGCWLSGQCLGGLTFNCMGWISWIFQNMGPHLGSRYMYIYNIYIYSISLTTTHNNFECRVESFYWICLKNSNTRYKQSKTCTHCRGLSKFRSNIYSVDVSAFQPQTV